ncbi:MAG: LysM peptidoglycan-binding domain-containing protein [Hungatella sp.]|nr:LysM peptidoglycan-binding domain-containing protein [Hungatella sp.]
MRKSLLFFWVAAVTGCIFFSFFLGNVLAKEPASPEMVSYYTYIEIQPGDTLWSIAETYTEGTDITIEEYIRRLKQMNHMRGETIHEGHYLTVMYQKPSEAAEEQ